MVGRGREEHVRELGRRRSRAYRRDDCALGALAVAHLDEAPEPAPKSPGLRAGGRKRIEGEPRRFAGRLGSDVR